MGGFLKNRQLQYVLECSRGSKKLLIYTIPYLIRYALRIEPKQTAFGVRIRRITFFPASASSSTNLIVQFNIVYTSMTLYFVSQKTNVDKDLLYSFNVTEERLLQAKKRAAIRHRGMFFRGVIIGFGLNYLSRRFGLYQALQKKAFMMDLNKVREQEEKLSLFKK